MNFFKDRQLFLNGMPGWHFLPCQGICFNEFIRTQFKEVKKPLGFTVMVWLELSACKKEVNVIFGRC